MTEEIVTEQSKDKVVYIKIAVSILVSIVLLFAAYSFGAHSKQKQIKSCQKALNIVYDVLQYDSDPGYAFNEAIQECDSSWRN